MELKNKVSCFEDEYAVSIDQDLNNARLAISFLDYIKRLIDIFISSVGIIICFPLVLFFCILIKLESGGPAFYFQTRVGYKGKYFKIIKLRSMRTDAEANGAKWADKDDPRITEIGKFIRKTRIDELPQFINVIKGDMSIIGPRPELPVFTATFNEEIPGFVSRLSVKPGITGWAQVNGGYDITPAEKLEYDLYYINHKSIKLENKIVVMTIKTMITGDGAR